MSLKNFETTLNFVEEKKVSDGEGGFVKQFVVGEPFKAVFRRQNVSEQALATQKGLNEVWLLNANKSIPFKQNDLIQFEGKRYRIVDNGITTPNISSLSDTVGYQAELVVI